MRGVSRRSQRRDGPARFTEFRSTLGWDARETTKLRSLASGNHNTATSRMSFWRCGDLRTNDSAMMLVEVIAQRRHGTFNRCPLD
jgi:hypothetical protein